MEHCLPGLEDAAGMALLKSECRTLVIADCCDKLFFVKVQPDLSVSNIRVVDMPLEDVRCLTSGAKTVDLLIGSLNPYIVLCNKEGKLKLKISLPGVLIRKHIV